MNSIRENFKKALIDAGVDKACEELGFNFEDIFLKNINFTDNKYREYKWYVLPHSKVGLSIHAVPPIAKGDVIPWEEWFVLEGKKIHNILYTKKHQKCDGEFEGSLEDKDHPKEVLGKKWHYYLDSVFTPALFQK